MKRDVGVYVDDVLECIEKIIGYTTDVTKESFLNNSQLQDAILRRLEIIGEAVKNIPNNFRDKYPHIEWKKIAGLRDILIHEYHGVKLEKVWKVINEDIHELKDQVKEIKIDQ